MAAGKLLGFCPSLDMARLIRKRTNLNVGDAQKLELHHHEIQCYERVHRRAPAWVELKPLEVPRRLKHTTSGAIEHYDSARRARNIVL